MASGRLEPPKALADGRVEVVARVTFRRRERAIHFRFPAGPTAQQADPLVQLCLRIAMSVGEDLELEGEVSPRLLAALPALQDLILSWQPTYRVISVRVRPGTDVPPQGEGVACFFAAGVDAFHTLLTNDREIDSLIHVRNFNRRPYDPVVEAQLDTTVHAVAERMGKQLVEVETDIVTFCHPYMSWVDYQGSVLAALGLFLAPRFRRVFIASHSDRNLPNYGSHPRLDPLWSTEALEFVHDGFEVPRVHKMPVLLRSEIALDSLQVCLQRDRRAHNCGRCEKCLRTMVGLRLAGALDRCHTFPEPLDLHRLAGLRLRGGFMRELMRENLEVAEARGGDPALIGALQTCLQRRSLPDLRRLARPRWRRARHWIEDVLFQFGVGRQDCGSR